VARGNFGLFRGTICGDNFSGHSSKSHAKRGILTNY
jgi:hypothetical protein